MPYSTKQHQAVLRCLEARGETACTAAELAEDLRREGCPVGLATIYRQLEKLEAAVLRPPVPRPPGLLSSEV